MRLIEDASYGLAEEAAVGTESVPRNASSA
jgi:hypothetical protein